MKRVFQVDYEEEMDGDTWLADSKNVLAADAETAIEKAKKYVLSQKGTYEDDEEKTVKWKITGFRLMGVALTTEIDL